MKWISERPCSVIKAWNTLCDAVNERLEYFGMGSHLYLEHLPGVPFERNNLPIDRMQQVIRSAANNAFDPGKFGQWYNCAGLGRITDPESDIFVNHAIDGYAFWMKSPGRGPYRRQTLCEFIKAAAKVIDSQILYPLPRFNRRAYNDAPALGMVIEAFLQTGSSASGSSASGIFRGGSSLLIDEDSVHSVTPLTLVINVPGAGRGRSSGHRWVYDGAGEITDPVRYERYRMPVLVGKGMVRSANSLASGIIGGGYPAESADLGTVESVIDFTSGTAVDQLDFSALDRTVEHIWERKSNFSFASVTINMKSEEIFLKKENFPELPYRFFSQA